MRRNKRPSEYSDGGKYIGLDNLQERTRLEQQQVETLMERGFFWEESVMLVQMREHIYENMEVRQRMEEDEYMQFARWLYEQGAINESEKE